LNRSFVLIYEGGRVEQLQMCGQLRAQIILSAE